MTKKLELREPPYLEDLTEEENERLMKALDEINLMRHEAHHKLIYQVTERRDN